MRGLEFPRLMAGLAVWLSLSACGGGSGSGIGSEGMAGTIDAAPTDATVMAADTTSPSATGSTDSVADSLLTVTVPATATGITVPIFCGVEVGPKKLTGTVKSVHDGDTLTLKVSTQGTVSVRLDSIDAPELAQPWGSQARSALSGRVLGRTVTVTYAKVDRYGRTVGAVFDGDCRHVNRDLVAAGMAWYYRAYQCEISRATRERFTAAQADASSAAVGLWAQAEPEAPWFYRNGQDATVPTCRSDLAAWVLAAQKAAGIADATTSAGSTSTTGSSGSPSGTTTPGTTPGTTPVSAPVCHTGPRGGTYTLTANGAKNYGGC